MAETLPPQPSDTRLGLLPHYDEENRGYPIRPFLAALPRTPRSYTWACSTHLDQGQEGSCTGHAVTHELLARPVVVNPQEATHELAVKGYREAQKIDPWPGEAYEGTDLGSALKIFRDWGYYKEFRWAFGIDDAIMTLGYLGPIVLAIPWYSGMFNPDFQGVVTPTGGIAGWHAILWKSQRLVWPGGTPVIMRTISNVDRDRSMARLHQSWGNWGIEGDCLISISDLGKLLSQGGMAAVVTGRTDPP